MKFLHEKSMLLIMKHKLQTRIINTFLKVIERKTDSSIIYLKRSIYTLFCDIFH